MPKEAAKTTVDHTKEVSGLFDQAFRALGDSFKVAMKAQEETVKFWSEAVGKVNPMPSVAGDWIPTAQKSADEYLRLLEASYRRNAELMKKVIQNPNGSRGIGFEERTRDLLEASMEVARDNAEDLASTNLRVAESWGEVLKKGARHVQSKAAAAS